jgi:Uri superfamily endonuclease
MNDSGTYALVIALEIRLRLRAGGLGIHDLIPGYYIYMGSALGGLSGRLRHHLKLEKRLHWHIDYLLREAGIAQIWYALGQRRLECTWNVIVRGLPRAISSIPGFGASDCHCSSHLTYFPTIPSFNLFQQKLRESKLSKVYQLDLTM